MGKFGISHDGGSASHAIGLHYRYKADLLMNVMIGAFKAYSSKYP